MLRTYGRPRSAVACGAGTIAKAPDVNAFVEPRSARLDLGDRTLDLARQRIEAGDLLGAAQLIDARLAAPELSAAERQDLEFNLGAALCALARQHPEDVESMARLHRAAALLAAVVATLPPNTARWAMVRTNLAIAHIETWSRSGDGSELMRAHMALDGAEAVFQSLGDRESLDWTRAVREHVTDLKDRRSHRRPG
jgi:hypothetical protein